MKKRYWVALVVVLVFVVRGSLFRFFIRYKSIGQRAKIELVNIKLQDEAKQELLSGNPLSIEQVFSASDNITNKQLHFSFSDKVERNPNKFATKSPANCIGYAALYTSVFDFLLKKQNESKASYQVEHHIGKLSLLGFDVHRLFSSAFLKDHDFVLIRNVETNEIIAVDPTISDYVGIRTVTFIE